ncbi:RagB/SusD family nutrient uptake outer membrane protein [Seonamhaeicola sp.]|uniref:RagB/SusD family nutrient uptake outer membrane protein n=1 Tax=Seonamhaeicola sp. TaxID=1912245 RepID=UPI002619CE49|nr:RagB/SusD family nutrient uptake outer membrane protein [Seonamhaeicola sp.]
MKNIIKLTFVLLILTGCDGDFLELKPEGAPTLATFWKSAEDVTAATNGLYIMNDFQGTYGRGMHLYSLIPSDDFIVGKSKGQIEDIKNFYTDGSGSYTRDIWGKHFIVIKRANDIITNVPNMDINTDIKNFALGQAYFMRGLCYFQLSVIYGDHRAGIPIVDENTETFFIERPSHVSESYAFAAQSFTKAAEMLPYFDQLNQADYGKPHKNAALGYLARTHLHNAQYDSGSWSKVVEACNDVINSGKNALELNFKDVFTIVNNWGPEYLWSVPSNKIGGSIFPGASLENKGWGKYNGWGYFAPTLELYESYLSGDSRREATLLKFGDTFTYFGEERQYWSTINWSGFQFNKYMEPYSYPDAQHLNGNGDHPTTDLNLPLLRYSHILLMKAEALLMQGQNGDGPLNEVRERAGLASLSGATMDDLKYERRAEFAGELFGRYEDLVRWGDAASVIPNALHGRIHVDKTDPNSAFTVEEIWPARPQYKPDVYHVWPIPPLVISTSDGTITQNEGW